MYLTMFDEVSLSVHVLRYIARIERNLDNYLCEAGCYWLFFSKCFVKAINNRGDEIAKRCSIINDNHHLHWHPGV